MKKILILSVVLAAGCLAAGARTWSFSDCVEYARLHNISLKKSLLTEESAAYSLEESKAQWQPTLDFATSQGVSNYPWGQGNKTSYTSSYGLNAGWTVWDGGSRENSIRRSELQTRIDRLSSENIMRTLETDLLQVYLNILYARESIAVYAEAVELSRAQAERTKALMEAGKASRVDYAQLNAQYEQDRYALVNAQGVYDTRRMELKKLLELGIDADFELDSVAITDEMVLAALPPIAETYDLAVATDVRISALGLEKDGAALDIDIAKASGKPRISLSAGIGTGYNAPGQSFGTSLKRSFGENIGLTLSVPIFNNKKTSMAVSRAKVQQINAELDIEQRRTELSQLVENWYIDTRSSQSRYEAALGQLASAKASNELVNEKFGVGYLNVVELMTAHNNLVEASHTLLQARFMALLGQKMIQFYRTATVTL